MFHWGGKDLFFINKLLENKIEKIKVLSFTLAN